MDDYNPKYRSNTRLIVVDRNLTRMMEQRIKKFVPPTMFGKDGWKFCGLNETLRFCKYVDGQHFSPHSDSAFIRSMCERSFLTCMIYLNDFDSSTNGGATRFLDQKTGDVIKSIQPEEGMAIVFPHAAWHDGEPLKCCGSAKYLLRTDVMYNTTNVDE
jgi:Rps23 Pro-64 3,4-dihydroxylase Tpa1-like proline 4-hydroxylase